MAAQLIVVGGGENPRINGAQFIEDVHRGWIGRSSHAPATDLGNRFWLAGGPL